MLVKNMPKGFKGFQKAEISKKKWNKALRKKRRQKRHGRKNREKVKIVKKKTKIVYCCRWAPSLGPLDATHQEVWGTKEYNYQEDKTKPTVFFGLYDLRDYMALRRHKGTAWILWAGSDIENLIHGFAFNDGKLKILSKIFRGFFTRWIIRIIKKAESYVEDEDEEQKLAKMGIYSKQIPSFLGKISDFPVSYRWNERPNVYLSGHPDRQEEYGFDFISWLANRVPECVFHLYGAEWKSDRENVVCHGLVSKEQFNEEIKNYQCGLRLNKSDGFSEITAKSVLMGQYPITRLHYPLIPNFQDNQELVYYLKSLTEMKQPNMKARNYYLKVLNKYPWNINAQMNTS